MLRLWRRCVAWSGPEHPNTLISMYNLASAYQALGKYAQAEALFRQNLDIRRRVLGPEHPDTLFSMTAVAEVYQDEGKYAEAEMLGKGALEIQRRVLGPEHLATIYSMINLAAITAVKPDMRRLRHCPGRP